MTATTAQAVNTASAHTGVLAQAQRLAAPVGRAAISALFMSSGFAKLSAFEGTKGYMESVGAPGELLPAVIAFEIFAPLAVIAGYHTRLAAFLLAGFSVLTAVLFHSNFADQIQQIMFFKNVAIAGGFLMIVASGPGAFSVDNRR